LEIYSRSTRIKFASRLFKMTVFVYTLVMLAAMVGVALGWVTFQHNNLQIRVSPHHLLGWGSLQFSAEMLSAPLVKLGLMVCYGLLLSKLFALYEAGSFFTARNIFYIQLLGYTVLMDWFMGIVFNLMADNPQIQITCSQPLLAVTILFIALIMDEGRKMQEEQELTV